MRRYSQRHNLSTLSEINITPLLDLAFVLLIIFMITTPLLENSMNLIIPSSGAANPPVNTAKVQTISIDRRETIKINDKTVTALCVAIPAMFGYNFLVTSIRGIIVEMDNFAAELASEFEHKYVDHSVREPEFRR